MCGGRARRLICATLLDRSLPVRAFMITARKPQYPSSDALLSAVLALGREAHLDSTTAEMVERFLDAVSELFRERALAVRVVDGRTSEPAAVFVRGGVVRRGIGGEYLRLKKSSIEKTQLKDAVASSARVKVATRWDSPFEGLARGFAIPLVAAGELYGVLDVGYSLDIEPDIDRDEESILPIANWLSVSLRNNVLRSETQLLRDYQARLIEHANALILGIDRRWRITVANHALCEITGNNRSEMIGRDLRDWLPPSQLIRLASPLEDLLERGGTANHVEIELLANDGDKIRSVWSLAAIGRPGSIQAVVAIGQDQTRLFDLQNQIIQAEKLATLGQLAAGVVHELNNPLTSISVYAEFLLKKSERHYEQVKERRKEPLEEPPQDGDLSESETKALEGDITKLSRIVSGAQRIQVFARDLVQYAKPAGDEQETISVNAVIRQSLSFCEHLFGRSDIELETDLAANLPPVVGVTGQVEQVVINLVTNAVHACDGSGNVSVETELRDGFVLVKIGDSGPGISKELAAQIFEPFFTTKADGRGTGLGLSIVSNIIDQHHGHVDVGKSRFGGAELVFALPALGSVGDESA